MTKNEDLKACREAFEKHFEKISVPPHAPTRDGNGYLERRSWENWQAAWQAARTPPVPDDVAAEEIRKIISMAIYNSDDGAEAHYVFRALYSAGVLRVTKEICTPPIQEVTREEITAKFSPTPVFAESFDWILNFLQDNYPNGVKII